MYEVSQDFRAAMEGGAAQHIRGTLMLVTGTEITLDDDTIIGEPYFESQCVENQDAFNFGELYAGKLTIDLKLDEKTDLVVGGTISLGFSVEGFQSGVSEEWIPLGVWDVKKADRVSAHRLAVEAMDRIDRLNVPMDTDTSSPITMQMAMQRVTELTGVEFAQTIADLQEFIDFPVLSVNGYGFGYAKTCREEVRMISQIIGGFAFANRDGEIEFRQFGNVRYIGTQRVYVSVLTIPASKRFSAKLSEYQFMVRSLIYTNSYGISATLSMGNENKVMSDLSYSQNRYIRNSSRDGDAQEMISDYLSAIRPALHELEWTPGRVEWYGDPTLDLGDRVTLTGAVAGTLRYFIITDMTWRFRGRQTLGSAGAGSSASSGGGSSSSGSSSSASINITNNVTLTINTVELTPYVGEVFASERTVADGRFSCKGQTTAFIDVTMILLGTEDATLAAAVHINQIAQTVRPKITLHDGEYQTLHFTVPVVVPGGKNSVAVVLAGACEVVDVQADVWGQELTAEAPDPTLESDYIYTISNSQATVKGYIGSSLSPKIPSYFEGCPTVIIGSESFTESEIQSVYIPDGVTRIESKTESYSVLEFIKSTGTQYIETDIVPSLTDKTILDIKFGSKLNDGSSIDNSYLNFYGSRGYFIKFGHWNSSNRAAMDFYLGYGWNSSLTNYSVESPFSPTITTRQNVIAERGNSSYGGKSCSANATVTLTPQEGLLIFGYVGNGAIYEYKGYEMYLYGTRIYSSNDVLVHNLVPVERSDGELGLYDTITNKFYGNAGTGTFVKGSATGELIPILSRGAFMNASQLAKARIPASTKYIGEWAFTNTALTSVRIAQDCEYFPTSFPAGCEVEFYTPDGVPSGTYGQLLDSEGKTIIDSMAARVYVKE